MKDRALYALALAVLLAAVLLSAFPRRTLEVSGANVFVLDHWTGEVVRLKASRADTWGGG